MDEPPGDPPAGGPDPEPGPESGPDPQAPEVSKPVAFETFYMPIYIITAVFGAIFIIGPILIRKSANKGIIQCCIMLTAFSMWLFWVTVYIAQMNPLAGPRVHNHTAAWIAHSWGDPAQ